MKKFLIIALLIAPMTIFAQKFGHFNSREIMENMTEVKNLQTEMQTIEKQYQKELQTMQDELTRKYEAFMTQKDSLPQNVQQRRTQELQDLDERLQQTTQTYKAEFEKQYQEKMAPIQQKVLNAIKEIAEAGGYVYIMEGTIRTRLNVPKSGKYNIYVASANNDGGAKCDYVTITNPQGKKYLLVDIGGNSDFKRVISIKYK